MEIVSRADARLRGLKHYFTGKACKRGHMSIGYVSNGMCVACNRKQVEKWRASNIETTRELRRNWTVKNRYRQRQQARARYAKNQSKIRTQKRLRYQANPETHRKRARKWRDENIAIACAKLRTWRIKNPLKVRANKSNRWARVQLASGRHTAHDIQAIMNRQHGKCVYCATSLRKSGYHIDHKKPLSRGGSNWPQNIQLTCQRCNVSKGAKTHAEFMKFRAMVA